ncbi:uncharacterized protein UV8b_00371 [Ustilaginoidea virens]|uniref:Uncharacterized protein n=1 Tax=Ustilaginoidea virens TaxID=1159556 RepID=A0A8E5HIM7_USTVR|nr:uncharacterized protein UV8b_00371 [Ustilaginoidea virens]QUC16130.1 hypothetical protein UV8b_00371 [Ustilaginoidea virens]
MTDKRRRGGTRHRDGETLNDGGPPPEKTPEGRQRTPQFDANTYLLDVHEITRDTHTTTAAAVTTTTTITTSRTPRGLAMPWPGWLRCQGCDSAYQELAMSRCLRRAACGKLDAAPSLPRLNPLA